MGWSIGFDDKWDRDIGYGVPAVCDHPFCHEKIDRGLAYVCCNQEPYGGEHGCGRFFCSEHEAAEWHDDGEGEEWRVCGHTDIPKNYISPDTGQWMHHKLTDDSWQQWRDENPDEVAKLKALELVTEAYR